MVNKMNKKLILLSTMIAIVAIGVFTGVTLKDGNEISATSNGCLPNTIAPVGFDYKVKLPNMNSVIPGYQLQAVDQHASDVSLWFSDHSLCHINGIPDEFYRGSILVTVDHDDSFTNSTKLAIQEFNITKDYPAKPQFVDVNGYKGIGWESFQGSDVVRLNNKVIDSTPIPLPARVEFFNDHDHTWYIIQGMRSMSDLLEIAKTIPQ